MDFEEEKVTQILFFAKNVASIRLCSKDLFVVSFSVRVMTVYKWQNK